MSRRNGNQLDQLNRCQEIKERLARVREARDRIEGRIATDAMNNIDPNPNLEIEIQELNEEEAALNQEFTKDCQGLIDP